MISTVLTVLALAGVAGFVPFGVWFISEDKCEEDR
jgi:hypothetical protein